MIVNQRVELERLKCKVCLMIDGLKKLYIMKWTIFSFQGDYDVVINDYEKAKSLFGNTEVPVFQKGKLL